MPVLPEFFFAIARVPAVAVGLPIALGLTAGYVTGDITTGRNAQGEKTIKSTDSLGPAFSPIWLGMYGLMGYASHLTVCAFDSALTPQSTEDADTALALYYAQLGLSLIWKPIFERQNMPKAGLADMALLTATAVAMTVKMHNLTFAPISTTWFLAPYCAWLGYTTYMNAIRVYNQEK